MATTSKRCASSSNEESVSDSDSDTDREQNKNVSKQAKSTKPQKRKGAGTYKVAYKAEWAKEFPIRAVSNFKHKFHCIPCGKNITCHHQGLGDVKKHCCGELHTKNVASWKKQKTMNMFNSNKQTTLSQKVIKAEVITTNFLVQHNLPIATADHLGPLFKEIFPDSKIAASYSCGRTKTSCILNEALAPQCHKYIIEHCQTHPYSVGTDGSNDTGVAKMNPVSIRLFDINRSKTVTNHFFDMCLTKGEDGAKAYKIFEAIEETFTRDSMLWTNCVSLSIDNTNTMIGANNSVASRFLEMNPELFVAGCPCHLAHIAASHANDAFSDILGINVEDICIDCFYWFSKSSKRKGKLLEYFELCNQDYQAVLKHLSIRWLSLQRCIDRILKKYPSLKSYFLSEESPDQRFQRLCDRFGNPLLEPALLFQSAAISLFTHFNLLLQRDEPTVHVVQPAMESLARKLANRIVLPRVLIDVDSVTELDLDDESIFIKSTSLFLGGTTKFTLNRLHNDGTINDSDYNKVHNAAHHYFKSALKYIFDKFPIDNDVLCNAVWVNVPKRLDTTWESVQFFLEKFSLLTLLQGINPDILHEEFVDYQTLPDDAIGQRAWKEAKVVDGQDEDGNEIAHHRVDILWWHLAHLKVPGTSQNRFKNLSKVAEIVLVIPHSNAEQERLFSIVRKNKTDSRSNLKLDGTLSSILAMKTTYPESSTPCYKWKPDDEVLTNSKKSTVSYNKKHIGDAQ